MCYLYHQSGSLSFTGIICIINDSKLKTRNSFKEKIKGETKRTKIARRMGTKTRRKRRTNQ